MKSIIGIVVLAGVVGGVYALNSVTRNKDGKSLFHVAAEPEISAEVIQPERRDITKIVQAPGAVEAFAEVDISAEVVGKIEEMPVEEGDAVKKGDLLCRLDDADYKARVLSAEANVAKLKASVTQGEADLDKAERDFRRQKQLSEADATSALELADYHTALIRAKALTEIRQQELIQAEAALQSAMEDLEKTVIRAPIDGVVSQRFAKQGEVVVTGTMNNPGTRIMVVSDLSKMQVRCRVDETDAPLAKPDQTARIFLQSDTQKAIAGHVFRVATKGTKPVGRDVVTFETLVMVDSNDSRVKPGMTANVEIEVARSDDALTIPVQAVVNRRRRDLPAELLSEFDQRQPIVAGVRSRAAEYLPVVFAVVDSVARPHVIETGISDDVNVEILFGIRFGETIVSGPYRSLDQLKDGSKVKLEADKKKSKEEKPGASETPQETAQASAQPSGTSSQAEAEKSE